MRKLVSVLLVSIMLLGLCSPVFATTSSITISAVFDSEKNGIIVSGTVTSARANIKLTLKITDPQGKAVYADQMVVPYQETLPQLAYEFDPIVLHLKNVTGDYTITVSGEKSGTAQATYSFVGADRQYLALKAVTDATDKTTLIAALGGNNSSDLGIDYARFDNLGEDGENAFCSIILGNTYIIPNGYSTDEEIEQLMETITEFRADYNTTIKISEFNDVSSSTELASWLNAYGSGFALDNTLTPAINESKLYEYVVSVAGEGAFINRICDKKPLTSMDIIRDTLYEQAVMTIIAERHYAEGKAIIEQFSSLFAIDWNKFNALSITDRGWVYENIKGNYATYTAVGTAFNSLVNSKTTVSGGSTDFGVTPGNSGSAGGSGGSGGSGGGGGFISPSVASNPVSNGANNTNAVFPDMGSAQWATAAVSALKSAGIVSGDEKGNFNPNNNITRAEYIKLVVLAMNLPLENSGAAFTDVSSADWYATYVNSGVKNGLITGASDNRFNPDEVITREDMCVILYRAFKTSESGNLGFSDSEMISDYAKAAVAFFVQKGIVNGMGDNRFAPKDNATRAQAAQVIYKVLNNI